MTVELMESLDFKVDLETLDCLESLDQEDLLEQRLVYQLNVDHRFNAVIEFLTHGCVYVYF